MCCGNAVCTRCSVSDVINTAGQPLWVDAPHQRPEHQSGDRSTSFPHLLLLLSVCYTPLSPSSLPAGVGSWNAQLIISRARFQAHRQTSISLPVTSTTSSHPPSAGIRWPGQALKLHDFRLAPTSFCRLGIVQLHHCPWPATVKRTKANPPTIRVTVLRQVMSSPTGISTRRQKP